MCFNSKSTCLDTAGLFLFILCSQTNNSRWRDRKEAFAEWKQCHAKFADLNQCFNMFLPCHYQRCQNGGNPYNSTDLPAIAPEVLVGDEKSSSAGPAWVLGRRISSTSTRSQTFCFANSHRFPAWDTERSEMFDSLSRYRSIVRRMEHDIVHWAAASRLDGMAIQTYRWQISRD